MVESRGAIEDMKLKRSYERLYNEGTNFIPAQRWQAYMTSRQLKVKPKKENISGLQLADLVAYPSRRRILQERGILAPDRETFSDRVSEILEEKYLKGRDNAIEGYGKKLLP